ncbi:MAG: hypothetical protein AAF724_10335 [Pseudomonadota bacterium]
MLAASGGFVFGSFTVASVALPLSLWRIAVGLVAVALAVIVANPWFSAACLVVLIFVASVEFSRAGTRCLVGAVFALLAVEVGAAKSPDQLVLAVYGLGVLAGMIATWAVGLNGIVPKGQASEAQGIFMFLFLAIGLLCSIAVAASLDEPRSYWVAFIFVLRGFVPLERQSSSVVAYAIFAGIGILLSVLLQINNVPIQVQLLIALVAAAIGTKYAAHPLPVSAFAFTVTIVLGSTTTMQDAVYRAEAIAIVVCLVLVLVFVLEWLLKIAGARLKR